VESQGPIPKSRSGSKSTFDPFNYDSESHIPAQPIAFPRSEASWPTYDQSLAGNGVVLPQFSPHSGRYSPPELSISSPALASSPTSYISPGSKFSERFDGHHGSPSESPGSGSRPTFEAYTSGSIPLDTVDEDKASRYLRWFPSFINSQAAQIAVFPTRGTDINPIGTKGKNKSGLNPDAKVFSLTRRPSLVDGVAGNSSPPVEDSSSHQPAPIHAPHASFASRMYGSIMHSRQSVGQQQELEELPAPSTPTGNFFSSLLAFAPSPAERQALQRGLEKSGNNSGSLGGHGGGLGISGNGSRDFLPAAVAVSPFTSPLASAQSSAVDLIHPPSAFSAPWDRDVLGTNGITQTVSIPASAPSSSPPKTSPVEKRSFSWLRNRGARASNSSLNEEKDKEIKSIPEAPTEPTETPASFGGRFRFTRHKTVSTDNSAPKEA